MKTQTFSIRHLCHHKTLLIGAALFQFTACGGGGGSDSPSAQSTPSPTPTITPTPTPDLSVFEYLSGGEASVDEQDSSAFSFSPSAISSDFELDANFKQGDFLFRGSHTGEGPILNNATCQGCHIQDGRGNPPVAANEALRSMLLKLNLGRDSQGNSIPDPIYGGQLQTFGLDTDGNQQEAQYLASTDNVTVVGEAKVEIEYIEENGTYPDGQTYTLHKPVYRILEPSYGDFAEGLSISPRVAPGMIGLGLLEAIPESVIEALADENDANNDGISGRVKWITNSTNGNTEVGRFGWKASTGSVLQQTSNAYHGDIGITNRFAPEEDCGSLQTACINSAEQEINSGDNLDLSDLSLAFVEFYSRLLSVPQRRGYDVETQTWSTDIAAGRQHFDDVGCSSCHVRYHFTGTAEESVLGTISGLANLSLTGQAIDVLSNQHIWPHTDLLLHDMGGECEDVVREDEFGNSCNSGSSCAWVFRCEGLADGQFDGDASGTEWRTAPLWGLGLVQTVNPNAGFLHDGRARTIEEAILWHGGEAENARTAFMNLSATQRAELLAYLQSL